MLSPLLLSHQELVSFWNSVLWFYYSSLEPQKALVFFFSPWVFLVATSGTKVFRSLYILIGNRSLWVIITRGHNHE